MNHTIIETDPKEKEIIFAVIDAAERAYALAKEKEKK